MFDGQFTTEPDFAYPQLWDQCVGAWFPGLGPQGGSLYDWSQFWSNGVLTGSSISGSWVLNNGLWSWVAGGTDYVSCGSIISALLSGSPTASLSAWVYLPTTGSNAYVGVGQTVGRRFNIQRFAGNTNFVAESGGVSSSVGDTVSQSGLQHFCMVFSAGTIKAWVNGVPATLGSSTGTLPSTLGTTGAFYIGRTQASNCSSGVWFDDVRVYERALSGDEVQLLYSDGFGRGIAYTPADPIVLAAQTGNRNRRLICTGVV